MSPGFNRRNFLRASMGLAMAGLAGLASRWAGRLGLSRAVADTAQVVRTQDLRLDAGELAGGSASGTKMAGGRLTLAASGSGEFVSPELLSSFPATHAGLHWRGSDPQAVSFWLRSSRNGVAWSEWQPVIVEVGHGREPLAETFGALIRVEKARRFQFRARLNDGRGKADIQSVTVTVLNTEEGPLGVVASAAPSSKPLTYSREAWGANEALRFDSGGEIWPRDYVPTKKIVIHHTATPDYASPLEAQADVRAIYTYHTVTRGWGDIGYCWLIDKFGNAYEGRRGRDGPGYDGPGGRELVSEDVVAGHAASYNHGSCGIALLGTFEGVSLSPAALSKLRDILAWECSRHGMNPQASADFLKANDSWHRGLPNICGHRDTDATACPGSSLYALLPDLRSDTASSLADSSAPTVSITSAPAEGTRTDRNVSYSWQGSGGSGAKQYSYYLEGWSLDSNILVVYESGFNPAREPAWSPWTTATQASFALYQPGHYTFHVRARDSLGRVSVYQDNRTLLADVTPVAIAMALDTPAEGSTVQQPFLVAGWAIDQAAASGTGVDAVHVYAYPADASGAPTGAAPVFLGAASYGGSRPDVGAVYGGQFTNSGYVLNVASLAGGFYRLVAYAHSTVARSWNGAARTIEVPAAVTVLDTPAEGSTVQQPFLVAGWAIDPQATSGTGVDAVHIYAYPTNASGSPTGAAPVFLGAASYGAPRPDVAAVHGGQFRNSSYVKTVTGLGGGFYRLVVYARSTVTGVWHGAARTIEVPSSLTALDTPAEGSTVQQPFLVAGWAIDPQATSGTGVDEVHIYAYPANASGSPTGAAPVFLGAASYGASRPDVGALFGGQLTDSGFGLSVTGLQGGFYHLVAYAHSTVTGVWHAVGRTIEVPAAVTALDTPAEGSAVQQPFLVTGWAIDRAAASGTGVDLVHVYAYPSDSSGSPTGAAPVLLGAASYGAPRPDVGALFGGQFTNSGYGLSVTGLQGGFYVLVVYAHSTVTGVWNGAHRVIQVP